MGSYWMFVGEVSDEFRVNMFFGDSNENAFPLEMGGKATWWGDEGVRYRDCSQSSGVGQLASGGIEKVERTGTGHQS